MIRLWNTLTSATLSYCELSPHILFCNEWYIVPTCSHIRCKCRTLLLVCMDMDICSPPLTYDFTSFSFVRCECWCFAFWIVSVSIHSFSAWDQVCKNTTLFFHPLLDNRNILLWYWLPYWFPFIIHRIKWYVFKNIFELHTCILRLWN